MTLKLQTEFEAETLLELLLQNSSKNSIQQKKMRHIFYRKLRIQWIHFNQIYIIQINPGLTMKCTLEGH